MVIQRTMVSTWVVELLLDKLNSLEDSLTSATDLRIKENLKSQLAAVKSEFQNFVLKHKVRTFRHFD
jgi:hypothetical protein